MSVYKKLLVLGVCAAVLTAPMQAAAANVNVGGAVIVNSHNTNSAATQDDKDTAKGAIEDYYDLKTSGLKDGKLKQEIRTICDNASKKADNMRTVGGLEDLLKSTKNQISEKLTGSNNGNTGNNNSSGNNGETTGGSTSSTEKVTRESAIQEIKDYAEGILMDAYDTEGAKNVRDEAIATLKKQDGEKGYIISDSGLSGYVSRVKGLLDKYDMSNAPADDKEPTLPAPTDYVQVGGNWVTPVATYSQRVNVVLPIVNMAKEDATDVIVTPVLDTDPENWPFDIEQSSYTVKLDRLAGENVNGDAMERRQEITWNFRTRKDVTSGYKKIAFNVQYTNSAGEQVNTTLNTYVKAVGAPGSGTGDTTSTPRLIVTGFDTDPEQVRAGDNFTLTVHMKNTAKRTAVSNVEFTLKAATEGKDADAVYEAFLPVAGSSTIYVESIPAGGTTDLVIDMKAKADLAQKPYVLNIDMKYEDEKLKEFTASSSVSIPVYQEARYEISEPEVMPSSIDVGSESNVMFSIYNTGKTTLYNVSVRFEGDSVSGGEAFVGNIQSGGTGNVDTMLTGVAPTTDDGIIKAIISFEDNETNKTEVEKELTLYVSEPVYDDMDMNDYDMSDDTKSGLPIWAKILLVLVVIAAIVAAVIIVKKKKKARAASLLEDELADSIGDDAKENKGE